MKQLFTTKYVSFMAIGLMAAMSLGSCSNDNEPNVPPTGTTLAKITMGVTGLPQTKQSADDVNLTSGSYQTIESIVLVPMIDDAWETAIQLPGSFNPNDALTKQYSGVAIANGVNKFRVYGGETTNVTSSIAVFIPATYGLINSINNPINKIPKTYIFISRKV